jgi:hypothetical protein
MSRPRQDADHFILMYEVKGITIPFVISTRTRVRVSVRCGARAVTRRPYFVEPIVELSIW